MRQNNVARRRRKISGWEYGLYFTAIFLVALPLSLIKSLFPSSGADSAFATGAGARRSGVIGRAWSEARVLTETIFSA